MALGLVADRRLPFLMVPEHGHLPSESRLELVADGSHDEAVDGRQHCWGSETITIRHLLSFSISARLHFKFGPFFTEYKCNDGF